jgi:hypothetical protein
MAMQLIIGALLIVITILIQGVGTTALLRLLFRRFADDGGDFFPEKALPAVILTALGLMLLHCLQILIWAVLILTLNAQHLSEYLTSDIRIFCRRPPRACVA